MGITWIVCCRVRARGFGQTRKHHVGQKPGKTTHPGYRCCDGECFTEWSFKGEDHIVFFEIRVQRMTFVAFSNSISVYSTTTRLLCSSPLLKMSVPEYIQRWCIQLGRESIEYVVSFMWCRACVHHINCSLQWIWWCSILACQSRQSPTHMVPWA